MIDFRYHLVSTVAVFLALALGIVLGTAAVSGPISENLSGDVTRLSSTNQDLETDVEQLQSSLAASDEFAQAVAPGLLRGTLADSRVLLVTTAQTPPDLAERLTPLLGAAGARVTGTLQLLPALSDPTQSALVEDLVAQVVPAGVQLPDGGPVEQATAELAAALVRPVEGDAVDLGAAQAVVSAFEEADLVRFESDSETLEQATVAVVLAAAPSARGDEEPAPTQAQQQAVLSLLAELDARSDGAVAAGPLGSADGGGLLQLLRASPPVATRVSSVDHADRGPGLVSVVLALAQERADRTGQYGVGAGATSALPALPAR